jgi:hypothetical protein
MWVKEGLAWAGWAWTLLDPKTARTERHWIIFYMAIIIGHFSFLHYDDGLLEGPKVPTRRIALRHYFSHMYRYEI